MVKCKNCGRKVFGSAMFCCHCGYPMAVAKLVPWPRQLWPVVPQEFWKATMMLSMWLVILAVIGLVVHSRLGLPCLYCGYPLALGLAIFSWAYLGSGECRR